MSSSLPAETSQIQIHTHLLTKFSFSLMGPCAARTAERYVSAALGAGRVK